MYNTGHRRLISNMKTGSHIWPWVLLVDLIFTVFQVNAQDYRAGTCPYQNPQSDFNYLKFMNGTWYEQMRFPSILQNGYKCDRRLYAALPTGFIEVIHLRSSPIFGPNIQTGSMVSSASPTQGKFTVRYPSMWNAPNKYWILETDYLTYSIDWACSDIPGIANRQYMWVYSRERLMPSSWFADMKGKIAKRGLATGLLEHTAQDCLII